MKIKMLALVGVLFTLLTADAAYQYNVQGNQGWLTFDGDTTVTFDLSRSGKDKDHENYIDRGEGFADYGWYNLEAKTSGSFSNGASVSFSEDDVIGLWVKDNDGTVYLSTKPKESLPENVFWGKTRIMEDGIAVAGGNFGSNGTHEYYLFKGNTDTPSGQPLPGIVATLVVGGGTLLYLKKRKKLYGAEP